MVAKDREASDLEVSNKKTAEHRLVKEKAMQGLEDRYPGPTGAASAAANIMPPTFLSSSSFFHDVFLFHVVFCSVWRACCESFCAPQW